MAKTIYEVKKVDGENWSREVGWMGNLLEVIEVMEDRGQELDTDDGYFMVDGVHEYVVTVNGKDVDPKSIHIQLYNPTPDDFFLNEDGMNEKHEDDLLTDEELLALSKRELVKKIRELEE